MPLRMWCGIFVTSLTPSKNAVNITDSNDLPGSCHHFWMWFIIIFFPFLSVCAYRCSSLIWSCNTHCVHSSDRVWVDGTDQSHSAYNDRCYISQRRGPEPPAINLWLHHTHQKATIPPRAWLGPSWVSICSSLHPFSSLHIHLSWISIQGSFVFSDSAITTKSKMLFS